MGEPAFSCDPSSEGCCLTFPETIIILVALIIVVQLGLKLAAMICFYLWYLVGVMFGMVVVPAQEKPKRTLSKVKKMYAAKPKPSSCWSYEDVPSFRRRKQSRSPSHRRLHCTLEPLKVTMNLQNESAPYRLRRRSYADYLPPHYYKYEREGRLRPRGASAPSAYAITRYRDAISGPSDPIVGAGGGHAPKRRGAAVGTELVPRQHAGEPGPDAERPGRTSRSHRPVKVHIYPVHPQTPPGSRSSSPERPSRRRRRRAVTSSQEEQQELEQRATRRKSRKVERRTSPTTLHYQAGSTNISQGQATPPTGKTRYYSADKAAGTDFVYRSV